MKAKRIVFNLAIIFGLFTLAIMALVVRELVYRWTPTDALEQFNNVVKDSTLVRVTPTNELQSQAEVFCEENDIKAISQLINNIKLARFNNPGRCLCMGDVNFEFYEGNKLLATVSFHHKRHLRWKGWDSDIKLTKESVNYLVEWIEDRVPKELLRDIWPE